MKGGRGLPRSRLTVRPLHDADGAAEVRKEFVILRELVKQHALQSDAGNEARLETVERHLRERLAGLPDKGINEEEREILSRARELAAETGAP